MSPNKNRRPRRGMLDYHAAVAMPPIVKCAVLEKKGRRGILRRNRVRRRKESKRKSGK